MFEVKVKKTVVFVNKTSSSLKNEFLIHGYGALRRIKGCFLMKMKSGFWHHPFWLWVGWIFNFRVKINKIG